MNKKIIIVETIGSDPEAFLQDKTSGKFISAIGLIPGDKESPFPVSEQGHAIQVDNVAVEVCIPPALNADKTFDDIHFAFAKIDEMVSKNNLHTSIVPSAEFDEDQLKHPDAKRFGCEPDFCAYTGDENPMPKASNKGLRSAGGHVHLGIKDPSMSKIHTFAQVLDLFLGVPSVLLDSDNQRRQLYGKAGAFRPKEFGRRKNSILIK